ncbi:hypothetical protein PTT_16813 [Pyrenophora teres f. teres 0-1]|uniref:V-type proton ATPase proteolipid subunit n=1 Tax=Pyrenophora teres f. teres (strain 0-1) TaxID=861557 RepID=E3S326_PYRTT|nr:hypothetical protein PTT_16813 [Pyrenophora teres f. teres 0-1]
MERRPALRQPSSPLLDISQPPRRRIQTLPSISGKISTPFYTQPTNPNKPQIWFPNFGDPVYAPFFGAMGCTSAIVFACFGAAYGTAKAGVGVSAMGVLRPDLIVKNIIPVVMAGIIGIYGLVVSVLISNGLKQESSLFANFIQLGAGLSVGLSGMAAGFAIGIVGDAGVRGTAQQPRLFVGMILILIFAEVLGLYGLIVALLMNSKAGESGC